MASSYTDIEASNAMLEGLTDRIRVNLKARILERIMPDVDAAVDASLADLKTSIERYADYAKENTVINILTEKRSK